MNDWKKTLAAVIAVTLVVLPAIQQMLTSGFDIGSIGQVLGSITLAIKGVGVVGGSGK